MSASADLTLVAERQCILLTATTAMREDLTALVAKARHLDEKWSTLLAEMRST